jgi:hypothetical protein
MLDMRVILEAAVPAVGGLRTLLTRAYRRPWTFLFRTSSECGHRLEVLRRYGEGGLIDNGKWSAFIPAGSATRAIIRSWAIRL